MNTVILKRIQEKQENLKKQKFQPDSSLISAHLPGSKISTLIVLARARRKDKMCFTKIVLLLQINLISLHQLRSMHDQ